MSPPQLTDMDVKEVLQTIVSRVARYLRRRGLLSDDGQAASDAQQQDQDGEQLALTSLAHAAALACQDVRPLILFGLHTFAAADPSVPG